jgi:hypothetical protein
MKNGHLLRSLFFLSGLAACGKSNHAPSSATPITSISFVVNDSTITYPVNMAYLQDVDSVQTTLISGQYADTSSKQGSLGIRFLGDTTGRFSNVDLFVTYTDGNGNVYTNTADTTNYVEVNKYPKTYNGVVAGSFAMTVSGAAGTIKFTNGNFSAIYQQ